MKKTLAAALAAALTIGAASTTFAAANPFSDVPRDHWAYDAVTQLAADGVVEGYGDGTFRGDRNITRYEMAQMVAKAMAKGDMSASDRALVDRLAAEFADELNNLGVRVSNLERNADMVKWNGKLRYTYTSNRHDVTHSKVNNDALLFRLEPSAEVNDHWHVKARLDATTNMKNDSGTNGSDTVTLKRAYAQGDYTNFQVKLGKIGLSSPESKVHPGSGNLLTDEGAKFSGAEVTFGNKLQATVQAGRYAFEGKKYNGTTNPFASGDTSNYQSIDLKYMSSKWSFGAGYFHLGSENFNRAAIPGHPYKKDSNDAKDANIWRVFAGYRFDKNNALGGSYANNAKADNFDNAYTVEYDYKGAKASDKGSWGAYVAYRKLGAFAAIAPTTDGAGYNQKGIEVGFDYVPFKNVVLKAKYFNGKDMYVPAGSDDKAQNLFGRVEFLF